MEIKVGIIGYGKVGKLRHKIIKKIDLDNKFYNLLQEYKDRY